MGAGRVIPPDGGWGWMVVFGSWMVSLLAFGLYRAGGIVMLACMQEFNSSRSVTAWIPILNAGVSFFLAPLSGALVRRNSYRQVVFVGGFICCVGLIICHYANRIEHVFIGYGVVLGIGLGLSINPTMSIVGVFFNRRRALATGLSFSGGAFGTFVIGRLLECLLDEYGLQGAFLVLSAIILHICVAATLFRPLSSIRPKRNFTDEWPVTQLDDTKLDNLLNKWPEERENGDYDGNLDARHSKFPSAVTNGHAIILGDDFIDISPDVNENSKKIDSEIYGLAPLVNMHDICNSLPNSTAATSPDSGMMVPLRLFLTHVPGFFSRKSHNTSSLPRIIVTTEDGEERLPSLYSSGIELDYSSTTPTECTPTTHRRHKAMRKGLRGVFGNPLFGLVAFSYSMIVAVNLGVVVMLPDYAEREVQKLSKVDGTICISAAAAADLIGRLGIGFLVDKLAEKKRFLYQGALFIQGVFVALIALSQAYWSLIMLCIGFGFLYGVCLVHQPSFLAEYLGVSQLPLAMGFMLALAGIPTICLGPLVGTIYDLMGSNKITFLILGSMLILSSGTWFLQPHLAHWQTRREQLQHEEAEV